MKKKKLHLNEKLISVHSSNMKVRRMNWPGCSTTVSAGRRITTV
jgi:hypothetical protein